MTRYLTAQTRALDPEEAFARIDADLSSELDEAEHLAGGLLLATAASGERAARVARRLADRWPDAHWVGTSFEGIVANGQVVRDEPALVVLAWTEAANEPLAFLASPGLQDAASLEAEIMALVDGRALDADDLILFFPEAVGALQLERVLAELGPLLAPARLAGAAAGGIDGHPAQVFFDGEVSEGSLLGIFLPSPRRLESPSPVRSRVGSAAGSRSASPWLEVTMCRERWVDCLDGEPAVDWVRRQLGLDSNEPIEPFLGRLLARVQRRLSPGVAGSPHYDERYVIGVDERRGSFSWAGSVSKGDRLALALPDAERAREALRRAVLELADTPVVLQFACRARDATLHGDPDVESAWAAHHAPEATVIGTLSPFQVVSGEDGVARIVVHSAVLAAVGPQKEQKTFHL